MLSLRALNRATLDRQLLLDRSAATPHEVVAHLVGMQAQEPFSPYFGLWSRVRDFDPRMLGDLLVDRKVVRAPLHRATIHLVTADDHGVLEPVLRPMVERRFRSSPFKVAAPYLDRIAPLVREWVAEQPRTKAELTRLLGAEFPDVDAESLAVAACQLLSMIQVPPRAVWGASGRASWTTAEHWLGVPRGDKADHAGLVLRYLAAFGPATVADVRAWSGLGGLKDVVEGLDLRRLVDEDGRELVDLPDAVLPDADVPAPVRFLPEFDNVLLGHDDRRRIISDEDYRRGVVVGGRRTVLVDGFVHGTWRTTRTGLDVEIFRPLTRAQRVDVETEGAALLAFAGVAGEVVIT
ncbi:winged helix DNA-binding domain-containing protein [Saccharothrix violaceirubra]|uniref:Winged helix DNA-binding protein n=1 Tax=Saccharothrix violaceirubra TaxID=413306 RepID=A0A7W7WW05_9PSEU|nr:winged helix DNA-binding domain-containing protein [Saccharothrix violaceirubra]MBB4965885.1 hypothetical protein [Saccharothrix violaceirubra]